MKKKELALYISVMIGVAFTAYAYSRNTEMKGEIEKKNNKAMQEWFLLQSRAVELSLPQSAIFIERMGGVMNAAQITIGSARIGLYMGKNQCTSCWQSELSFLAAMAKIIDGLQEPFVLAGNYRSRDIKLLLQQEPLPLPCYGLAIDTIPQLRRLAAMSKPFLFLLHSDGRISDVIFPDDAVRQYMKQYFEDIAGEYGNKCDVAENADSEILELLNPKVDLGEVRLRKKQEVKFRVKNISDTLLTVHDVVLSCDCLSEKSIPKSISPGETVEFIINLLPTASGNFMREISFSVNDRTEPYNMELYGTVVTANN